jgi:hypothetical protein
VLEHDAVRTVVPPAAANLAEPAFCRRGSAAALDVAVDAPLAELLAVSDKAAVRTNGSSSLAVSAPDGGWRAGGAAGSRRPVETSD